MSSFAIDAFPDSSAAAERFVLDCRGRTLDCRPGASHGAHVMGILNVTPDSFSDGGEYTTVEQAVERAAEMQDEGAVIIDVGGESSRPAGSVYGEGAAAVAVQEELDRVVPVVEAIVAELPDMLISVDTYKPAVARATLEAGAHLINDITGLRHHPETAEVAASFGAPIVVMHSLGRPGDMPHAEAYDDVVGAVKQSLTASIDTARKAGAEQIIVDPGFGFGKSVADNLTLVNATDALLALGYPVLIGVSRKSTVGAVLGTQDDPAPIGERLFGTLGVTAVAVLRGASLVRTHDVRPTVEMLRALGVTIHHRL